MSPEAARELVYSRTVLSRVAPLSPTDQATLVRAIPGAAIVQVIRERDEKRTELDQVAQELRRVAPEHGVPEAGSALADQVATLTHRSEGLRREIERLQGLVDAGVRGLNLTSEAELVTYVTETFPRVFIERAKAIATAELDENAGLVRQEMARYGVNFCPIDSTQRQALRAAARDLFQRDEQIAQVDRQVALARSDVDMPSGGVPDPSRMSSSYYDLQRHTQRRNELQEQRSRAATEYGARFPVLLGNIDLRALARGTDEQVDEALGGKLNQILDNIETTKQNIANGRLKVWNLRNIMETTARDLGVANNPSLMTVVNEHVRREQTEESVLRIAIAALALTAALIATFATAGSATFLVASAVMLGASGYTAYQSAQTYAAEAAAQNVALDPQIADISRNEPDLLGLIMDLVGVGLDVAGVVSAVSKLRTAYRSVRDTGRMVEFARAAEAALGRGAAASRVVSGAARDARVVAAVERTIEVVGNSFRRADMAAVTQRLYDLCGEGVARAFHTMAGRGNVHALTEEALEAVYGAERAAEMITRERVLRLNGFYDPANGKIFIRAGARDSVAATVVHESVHFLQDIHGVGMRGFMAEWQAHVMEREFLRRLAFEAGEQAVPLRSRTLLNMTDEQLGAFISSAYGYTMPGGPDVDQAILRVLEMAKVFRR